MTDAAGTVLLRDMRWQDLRAVLELEQQLHPDDAWSAASWWSELALRPRRDYVVAQRVGAEPGAQLLGYAGSDLAGECADVMTLGVAPHARGRGLGDALLHELHRRAATTGAREMVLEVREDNAAAQALYRRHGYQEVRRRPAYYRTDAGPVDAIVLGVALPQTLAPTPTPTPIPVSTPTARSTRG